MSWKPFRGWSHWIVLGFLVLVGLSKTTPLAAQAQTKSYPVSLELLAPTSGGNKIPTVTWGGWPLVLRMSANQELGIGTPNAFPRPKALFPVYSESGLIVFEDPDGCHSWLSSCPVDETYLAFTPGTQLCRPEFAGFPPCLAGSVPSLVLLSDSGPGQGGANLGSYVTVVGYELDDTSHRTNVVASLTAPNGLLSPSVTIDTCRDELIGRVGTQTLSFQRLVELLNTNNVATLRAFVVSRTAPTEFADLNGDGVIGAKDAELAGFNLLSREVVFQVRTLHQVADLLFAPRSDLDGDGLSDCIIGGPAGGGGALTPVPR